MRVRKPDLFFDAAEIERVPVRRVRWKATYRLVSDRYPPIEAFERIANREDWSVLHELEQMTHPGHRQETGQISLVPVRRRVLGPGASAVMAPFVLVSKSSPSRFTDGSYGVYYAGRKFETALREVAFHRARFHAATKDPPLGLTLKSYKGSINAALHDIRGGGWDEMLDPDPDRYSKPQAFAQQLRDAGSKGIAYPSVRHQRGECIGAFWPDVVSIPVEDRRIALKWDGKSMTAWFDFTTNKWSHLAPE